MAIRDISTYLSGYLWPNRDILKFKFKVVFIASHT